MGILKCIENHSKNYISKKTTCSSPWSRLQTFSRHCVKVWTANCSKQNSQQNLSILLRNIRASQIWWVSQKKVCWNNWFNLCQGWFTLDGAVRVFCSGLHQHWDRKISISLWKWNCLETHVWRRMSGDAVWRRMHQMHHYSVNQDVQKVIWEDSNSRQLLVCRIISVSRFGRNFATLAIFTGLFSVVQEFEFTLANFNAMKEIFNVVNGQILKKYLAIWSHWIHHNHHRTIM